MLHKDNSMEFNILPYLEAPASCEDYDPAAMAVAERVAIALEECMPQVKVEHVGSTAVPGCPGKGVVDLMLLYPEGLLPAVRGLLAGLGFQRQSTRDPFPEDRPMRLGAIEHRGQTYRLHIHVLAVDSSEAARLRAFRDRLRADDSQRDRYGNLKRQILAEGITDSVAYCERKGTFFREG